MGERWLPIPGWPPYEVSNAGAVRRVVNSGRHHPRVLSPFQNNGYMRINLCHNGKRQMCDVHVLLALAFLGPKPSEDAEVNHIDGVKLNTRLTNIEWTTRRGNAQHAHAMGLQVCKGERNGYSKLTEEQVYQIRSHIHMTVRLRESLARTYNVSPSTIYDVWTKRTWSFLTSPALGTSSNA